jgi:DNA end-binding protein Ku
MALRPYWTGNLRMSLVTLSVSIYSAINRARSLPLHEIDRDSGDRVRHMNVTDDGEEVEKDDIIKGYEVEKGQYVLIEPDEIKDLRIPSSKTLDIKQFVGIDEVDEVYFDNPYFVAPSKSGDEQTFSLIRDALRSTKTMAIGQLAIAGRERLCAIKAHGSGMVLMTLRYEDEVRDEDPYFEEIRTAKHDSEELDLARELITRKTAKFDPGKFHDHYREALKELIEAKIENREPVALEEDIPTPKVVNLMDALRRSLAEDAPAGRQDTGKSSERKTRKPAAQKPAAKKSAAKTKAAPRKKAS